LAAQAVAIQVLPIRSSQLHFICWSPTVTDGRLWMTDLPDHLLHRPLRGLALPLSEVGDAILTIDAARPFFDPDPRAPSAVNHHAASFLILIAGFATLDPWLLAAPHPCTT
jgi:hypothetical protein